MKTDNKNSFNLRGALRLVFVTVFILLVLMIINLTFNLVLIFHQFSVPDIIALLSGFFLAVLFAPIVTVIILL